MLLGIVIENISKKSFEEVIASTILEPLGITGATFKKPKDCIGVIPACINDWAYNIGVYAPYVCTWESGDEGGDELTFLGLGDCMHQLPNCQYFFVLF